MGKLSGIILILAGVSIAAYALSPQHNAAGTKVATAQDADPPSTPDVAQVKSPVKPLAAPTASAPAAAPAPALKPAPADATPTIAGEPTTTPSEPPAATSPPAVVLAPPPMPARRLRPRVPATVRVAEAPPRTPVGETKATASPPLDRPALAREIQRELKRTGCYHGQVSGVWSSSVRQAMKTFTDRVNASLPVDQPDPVLLAMVRSQTPGTCSAACPKGQSRAAGGRCMPDALVANSGKHQPVPGASDRSGRAKPAPADAAAVPLEGRMSLAGPTADVPRQARSRPQRTRGTPRRQRARAYYRSPNAYARQRSAQGSGLPRWRIPFLLP